MTYSHSMNGADATYFKKLFSSVASMCCRETVSSEAFCVTNL